MGKGSCVWPTIRAEEREKSSIFTIALQKLERKETTQSEEELELEFGEICELSVKKEGGFQ